MINKNDSNSIKEVLYMSWSTLKNYNKLKMMLKNDNVFYQEYNLTGQKIVQIDSINISGNMKDYINKYYKCTSMRIINLIA